MEQIFVIAGKLERHKAASAVKALSLPTSQASSKYEVVIREHKTPKTLEQNSMMWVNNTRIAERLNKVLIEASEMFPADPLIVFAMQKPWTKESVHKNITKPQFIGGESSTKQGLTDMRDVIGKQEAWMAEIGVFDEG